MEITLTLSDDIAKQIQNLPNPNEFVSQIVKDALKKLTNQQQKAKEPWAKIAQRIHTDPVHLAGYSQQLKKDMREFRENFEFLHDRT
ncbi:hypothetical protein PN36_17125 [Candidatus Thiomargarita nelsonii]|uniref:Uncharacterized protein n=1 Tax=Candidatus Thiomargarita nelsonii TaxID=1003181 RepID=A0A0A6RQC8_9GAMM|nr:hypothetical protein PN36_17125 [Candidatus Thiomargarita nelsonii]